MSHTLCHAVIVDGMLWTWKAVHKQTHMPTGYPTSLNSRYFPRGPALVHRALLDGDAGKFFEPWPLHPKRPTGFDPPKPEKQGRCVIVAQDTWTWEGR